MVIHEQQSSHEKVWYDLSISDAVAGTLTIPAGQAWVRGAVYSLPAYNPTIGANPFRLFVEKTVTGADYLLDLTGFGEGVSFAEGVGSPIVAWRDAAGGAVHVLRSVS